jgi:hypothetical protein
MANIEDVHFRYIGLIKMFSKYWRQFYVKHKNKIKLQFLEENIKKHEWLLVFKLPAYNELLNIISMFEVVLLICGFHAIRNIIIQKSNNISLGCHCFFYVNINY